MKAKKSKLYETNFKAVIKRDVKGLYSKALKGGIDNFIGNNLIISYELPENPDIILDTEKETVEKYIYKMYDYFVIQQIAD